MEPDLELRGFDNVCRLFPLPEVVFFPHAVLPLHIFEPRYRQMTEEALASDRLIAMVQTSPGSDREGGDDPPVESIACIGKVFDFRRLPDGRFNLLLVGLKRVRILRELPRDRLYRRAEVELLEDVYSEDVLDSLRSELIEAYRCAASGSKTLDDELSSLFDRPLPLGVVTDLMGHSLGLPPSVKQSFLAETRVETRARRLIAILRDRSPRGRQGAGDADWFPPPFSLN